VSKKGPSSASRFAGVPSDGCTLESNKMPVDPWSRITSAHVRAVRHLCGIGGALRPIRPLAVNRFGERSDEGEPCDHGVPKKYHLALTMPAAIK